MRPKRGGQNFSDWLAAQQSADEAAGAGSDHDFFEQVRACRGAGAVSSHDFFAALRWCIRRLGGQGGQPVCACHAGCRGGVERPAPYPPLLMGYHT